MIKMLSFSSSKSFTVSVALLTFGLTACETVPEPVAEVPEPVAVQELEVEIYEPEPEIVEVPSIDIKEYERQQAEAEAARLAAEEALKPKPTPKPAPVIEKTLEERLASAKTPDRKISILQNEPASDDISLQLISAYEEKLAADRASGDDAGAAQALVYLGKIDAKKPGRDSNLSALEKYAEALELDPENAEAPRLVSQMRGELQSYSEGLHKSAVSFFVKQDFNSAISRWKKVLLIDPGNNAARDWYNQAIEAKAR